jgi:peptidoglycan/LPS O-acetylase OafA/YrhL
VVETRSGAQRRAGRLPGLDGLRGLSVVAVVIAHAQLQWGTTPSSLQGVTTFFVLSGFLITTLLLREREQRGRIDLRAFWGRRALRLLPALFVFVAGTGLVWWLLGMTTLRVFAHQVVPVIFYYANLTRSFDWDLGLGPFPHTWSLAVEEQFYLLWPLVLIALLAAVGRLREPWRSAVLLTVMILLTVASAVCRVKIGLSPGPNYNNVHWLPHTTVFSMTAGAALAVVYVRGWRPGRWVRPASFVALPAFFLFPLVLEPRYTGWVIGPVVYTAVALVAIAMVCGSAWTLFELAPLRAIGTVSYGWYLWHLPALLLIADPNILHRTSWKLVIMLVTLGIAGASWRFIEKPLLTRFKSKLERVRVPPTDDPTEPDQTDRRRTGQPRTEQPADPVGGRTDELVGAEAPPSRS